MKHFDSLLGLFPRSSYCLERAKLSVEVAELLRWVRCVVACVNPDHGIRMKFDFETVIWSVHRVAFTDETRRNINDESVIHILIAATIGLRSILAPCKGGDYQHNYDAAQCDERFQKILIDFIQVSDPHCQPEPGSFKPSNIFIRPFSM